MDEQRFRELEERVHRAEATAKQAMDLLDRYGQNGLSDLLTGHGFQRYTSNMRLGRGGIQIEADQSGGVTGMWYVPVLVPDPNNDSVNNNKAYIVGTARASGDTRLTLTAVDLAPPTAPVAAADIELSAPGSSDYGRIVLRARVDTNLTGGGEWGEVWLNRVDNEAAATLQLYQTILRLVPSQAANFPFTSDPANRIEGDIWYNTTDNQFKGVDASATKAFLMEGDVVGTPAPIVMSPGNVMAIGTELAARGATPASSTFPASNRAVLYPFYLTEDITVTQLWAYNGATASGNIDVGIYDDAFARVIAAGSTAQAGTSDLQVFNVTDTPLTAGQYYVAVAMDNTTGTLERYAPGVGTVRSMGMFQMASAFPLPTTITPAAAAASFVPVVGWTRKTTI